MLAVINGALTVINRVRPSVLAQMVHSDAKAIEINSKKEERDRGHSRHETRDKLV